MVRDDWERIFPGLVGAAYTITSPSDPGYNCIAWAAQDDSRWWWPDAAGLYFWPENSFRCETLEAFVEVFRKLGFQVCNEPSWESGWEKIAIYAKEDGAPTHAARQLADGRWTSKLGMGEDIVHSRLEDLSGEVYGNPVIILRRRVPDPGFEKTTP